MAASNFTIDYDFCVASLQSDLKSSTVDARGLALIAARLSLATATSTKTKIDGLIQGSLDPTVKAILGLFSNSYSNMILGLTGFIGSIKAENNTDAVEKLDFVKDRSPDCEDSFLEGGKRSPVAKEDNDLADLTTLALAVTISLV